MKPIAIKQSEHVFIAGRTGSGKTYLARNYLARYPHVYCLDTKGTLDWPEVAEEEVAVCTHLSEVIGAKAPKVIYQPVFEELNEEVFNEFFRFCYFKGDNIVYVDEVMSICPNAFKMPDYFRAILTRGRELNVACWTLTQRPASIPLITMSEATHFFVFALNLLKDRQRLVEVTTCEELSSQPGKYQFWYYNIYQDKAILAKLVKRDNKEKEAI